MQFLGVNPERPARTSTETKSIAIVKLNNQLLKLHVIDNPAHLGHSGFSISILVMVGMGS